MAKFSPPPGCADIFPAEAGEWRNLEKTAAAIFSRYGYGELRTPIFEYTEVFTRGLGDDTEVVQKEMYTFEDRGGRSLTLRPEGTAGVMRAVLNTDVMNGNEQRVYYCGPMFRGERPSAGRRRQFHQIGSENVGRIAPELDAESIAMLAHFLREIGIKECKIKINTRGVAADRIPAGAMLREYFSRHIDDMCDDGKVRREKNIWRILDCKQETCRKIIDRAPKYFDSFTDESKEYFSKVCRTLDLMGINYEVDPMLVRGLDYYIHTVFELSHSALGEQIAIAGGGRYELFLPGEKKPVMGVGFAAGMERLLLVREALGLKVESENKLIFLLSLGDNALLENLKTSAQLRQAGFTVALEPEAKSMKSQMRSANRLNAALVIIRGDDEVAKNIVICKNMADGIQSEIPLDKLAAYLQEHNLLNK